MAKIIQKMLKDFNGCYLLLSISVMFSLSFCTTLSIGLITSLAVVSFGQLLLMMFSWVSMTLHISLVLTILYFKPLFNSAYYTLFIYQFFTEFGMFLIVEILLRPRKYNFFNLYNDKMTPMAFFQYSILTHFQIVVYCGHSLFACNRFTALYFPLRQNKFSNMAILTTTIWLISFLSTISLIIPARSDIKFVTLPNGIIQLFPGKAMESTLYVTSSSILLVVVTCAIFYAASFKKLRKISGINKQLTGLEVKLLVSAFIAATPLIIELARSIIQHIALFHSDNNTTIILTELWFYVIEIIIGIEAWVHLLINTHLQQNWKKHLIRSVIEYSLKHVKITKLSWRLEV